MTSRSLHSKLTRLSDKDSLRFLLIGIAGVIVFSMSVKDGFAQNQTLESKDNISTPSNLTNWTTYQSEALGISFDYPSDWEIQEKENRFDNVPDVSVSDGSSMFFVIKLDNAKSKLLRSFGLADSTKAMEEGIAEKEDAKIIEETDVTKYKLGGVRTGTFLYMSNDGLSDFAAQIFVVTHDGKAYNMSFKDSTLTFDDPETQNIMNKIIQSFKFLA